MKPAYDPFTASGLYGRLPHMHTHRLSDRHGERMSEWLFAAYIFTCISGVTLAFIGLIK